MDFRDILYAVDGPLGLITLNRPAYRNAQGYRMLDEIDPPSTRPAPTRRSGW
ncbi:MAG TPA: hypothetical protein VFC47_02850 [Caulobacteraceae bacterium]|nr:hypothetical protein [Caulobacteraceae bacterium]